MLFYVIFRSGDWHSGFRHLGTAAAWDPGSGPFCGACGGEGVGSLARPQQAAWRETVHDIWHMICYVCTNIQDGVLAVRCLTERRLGLNRFGGAGSFADMSSAGALSMGMCLDEGGLLELCALDAAEEVVLAFAVTLQDLQLDELSRLVVNIEEQSEFSEPLSVHNFKRLLDSGVGIARRRWRHENKGGDGLLFEAHIEEMRNRKRKQEENHSLEVAKRMPKLGKAAGSCWPTRLGKRHAEIGDVQHEREEAERAERQRWLDELRAIMYQAKMPAAPAIPASTYKTLLFMEHAAELHETDRIYGSSIILSWRRST